MIRSPETRLDGLLHRSPVVVLLLGLLLAGCFSNPVRQEEVTEQEFAELLMTSAITGDRLSEYSTKVLRTLDLEKTWAVDPQAVLPVLRKEGHLLPAWELALARAEIAYHFGRRSEGDVDASRRWYLDALLEAVSAVRTLNRTGAGLDPRQSLLILLYNRGLARVIALTLEAEGHPSLWKHLPSHTGDRALRLAQSEDCWSANEFEKYLVADNLAITGLNNRHRVYGLGVPLIGVRDNTTPRGRKVPEFPPTILASATAVLDVSPDGSLELRLYDPDRAQILTAADGSTFPIAADRSAPIAYQFARSNLRTLENKGLRKPELILPLTGLYLSEPYDPEKIPLVLVHGLWSSPLAWREVWNEIRGDELLRTRYQIWFYAYPSGLPILVNGFMFKRALRDLRAKLDPEGDDPAMQDFVCVGHSMGGLIAKLMVKDSGTRFWDLAFRVPPEELKVSSEHRRALKEILVYEPHPYVRRLIFMAVPHGGSSLAQGLVGSIGSAIITLPDELTEPLAAVARDNREATRLEEGEGFEVSNSIDNLSPGSPVLKTMAAIPYAKGLPYHTILGDDSGKGGGPGTTDGVVPWESAHIEGAVSELVIESDHNVPLDPAALLELRRILRLHLEER